MVFCIADVTMGQVPTKEQLDTLRAMEPVDLQAEKVPKPAKQSMAEVITLGAGLPQVPKKLVARIQAGEFIDMSELLPDRLSASGSPLTKSNSSEASGPSKQNRRNVANILEWLQCYSIYVAVVTEKIPEKIKDLLGYQALIIQVKMENEGDAWLGYDCRFRQIAASKPNLAWAQLDPTLRNLAFSGATKVARCSHCFSLTHASKECDWAPQDPPQQAQQQSPRTSICMTWNYQPECPYTDCRYKHICLHCYGMHRATYCPERHRNPLPRGGNGGYQPYPRDIPPARREQQAGYPPRFAGNPQHTFGYNQRGG